MERVETLKKRLKNINDSEEIMSIIIEIIRDGEYIPEIGNYYTFIYNAKTIRDRSKEKVTPPIDKIYFDQHPLIQVLSISKWGFTGYNFHWSGIGNEIHNYTWNEISSRLYQIRSEEINYFKTINYMKMERYKTF